MQQGDNNSKLSPEDFLRSLGYQGQLDEVGYKEAMQKAMDKMFDDSEHNGTVCHRLWCQDMAECLWVTLRAVQEDFNDLFFDGELKEEDFLIKDKEIVRFLDEGCNLPESFYESGTLENHTIDFVLQLLQALQFTNSKGINFDEFIESDGAKQFAKDLYSLLKFTLIDLDAMKRKKCLQQVSAFISSTEFLEKEDKDDFLIMLRSNLDKMKYIL